MPFYRQLDRAQAETTGFRLLFAGTESAEVLRDYLALNGLARAAVSSIASVPGLRGTPAIIILDARGLVVRSWQGVLSPIQKAQLMELL